jgi:predicted lipid-binding transport protein (Tim44 family)
MGMGGMGKPGGSPLGMIGGMLGGALGGAKGGMVGGLAGNLLGGILSSVMTPRTTTGSEIDQRSTQRSVEKEKRDKKVGNVQTTAPPPSNSRPNTPQSSTPSGAVHPSPQLLAILDAEYGSQPAIVRNISQQHSGLGRRAAPSVA